MTLDQLTDYLTSKEALAILNSSKTIKEKVGEVVRLLEEQEEITKKD